MRTSEILNKAADLIEERGWTQMEGWNQPEMENLCLEGGILAALGIQYRQSFPEREDEFGYLPSALDVLRVCPAYTAVQDYLDLGDRAIYYWNDRPGRTKDEVIETLRTVAVIEAAKEEVEALRSVE